MKKLDWKFLLPLVIAIISAYISLLPTLSEWNSRSLAIETISQINFDPLLNSKLTEIKVATKDLEISHPSLTVLRLRNDGSKPILPDEFISPITIMVKHDISIVRAVAYPESSENINMPLEYDKQSVRIGKSLMNPGESMKFLVITSGEAPEFSVKARIVGISQVKEIDQFSTPPISAQGWLLLVLGLLPPLSLLILGCYDALKELFDTNFSSSRWRSKIQVGASLLSLQTVISYLLNILHINLTFAERNVVIFSAFVCVIACTAMFFRWEVRKARAKIAS